MYKVTLESSINDAQIYDILRWLSTISFSIGERRFENRGEKGHYLCFSIFISNPSDAFYLAFKWGLDIKKVDGLTDC